MPENNRAVRIPFILMNEQAEKAIRLEPVIVRLFELFKFLLQRAVPRFFVTEASMGRQEDLILERLDRFMFDPSITELGKPALRCRRGQHICGQSRNFTGSQ